MAEPYLTTPSDWTRISLEPDVKAGYISHVSSGGTPSTTNDDFWDGDVPWLTPKEITRPRSTIFVSSTDRLITQLAVKKSAAKLLPANTVMLTKRAPVGAVAINTIPMATNQGFLNFSCGPNLRPQYLAYWFQANQKYLYAVANGSTYPELYSSDLFEFELSVPSLEVQDRILSLLSSVKLLSLIGLPNECSVTMPEKVILIQKRNQRLMKFHDELLPLLLSGQIIS